MLNLVLDYVIEYAEFDFEVFGAIRERFLGVGSKILKIGQNFTISSKVEQNETQKGTESCGPIHLQFFLDDVGEKWDR